MVKLKKTNKKLERGGGTGKKGVFLQLFQIAVSPWMIELQAHYLFQNVVKIIILWLFSFLRSQNIKRVVSRYPQIQKIQNLAGL